MTESEFTERFERDSPMLKAWGDFVAHTICDELNDKLAGKKTAETFLKLPVCPRIKSLDSALEKVFVRKLDMYKDPYEDLTDKVGVRFVTLLTDEIRLISEIVKEVAFWNASEDKNFEDEIYDHPELFNYQSVHFIVRAKHAIEYGGFQISEGTPCEIQIRSLLQHAYSELSHDTVYKPKAVTTPKIKRYIARSMALIETTDELLCRAKEEIVTETGSEDVFLDSLHKLYQSAVGSAPIKASKSEQLLIDAFREKVNEEDISKVIEFYKAQAGLLDVIKDRASGNVFYRMAAVLLIYYLVAQRRKYVKSHWPLGSKQAELEQIFTDFGFSYASD